MTVTTSRSRMARALGFMRHEPAAMVASAWLLVVVLVAATAPMWVTSSLESVSLANRFIAPLGSSSTGYFHLLGTDQLGRDFFTVLVLGTRNSITIALFAALAAVVIGLIVGAIAGYVSGKLDSVISRIIDAQLSFPPILFALLFLVSVGPSPIAVILVLAVGVWPSVARVSRGLAIGVRTQTFSAASRALGAGPVHIIWHNVLPNILGPVAIYGTVLFAVLMLGSAGLDFLGLGLQPPETSWGMVLAQSRDSMQRAWWLVTFPGLAILLTTVSINLVAIALRRRSDPLSFDRIIDADPARAAASPLPPMPGHEAADVAPTTSEHPVVDDTTEALLSVRDLRVSFATDKGPARAVRGVTFDLVAGEFVALVGESGSGKSVTAKTIMGVTSTSTRLTGSVRFRGRELLSLPDSERRAIYGSGIAVIQQEALAALNPAMTIGSHFVEAIRAHDPSVSKAAALERGTRMLEKVGIPDAPTRARQYPHEFSGGMSQRVLIALAIVNRPALLIADEPTTALDVTYQAQIMDLLEELRSDEMSILLITHDLGLVSERADRVLVMYAGQVVEHGTVEQVSDHPAHPYTRALLDANPSLERGRRPLIPIVGSPPNAARLPAGCAFNPRCSWRVEECTTFEPAQHQVAEGHVSRCHRAEEVVSS